jgi:hypothetical protein
MFQQKYLSSNMNAMASIETVKNIIYRHFISAHISANKIYIKVNAKITILKNI